MSTEDSKLRLVTVAVIVAIAVLTVTAVVLALRSLDVMEDTAHANHAVSLTPLVQPTADPFAQPPEELFKNRDVDTFSDVLDDKVDLKSLEHVLLQFKNAKKLQEEKKFAESLKIYQPVVAELRANYLKPAPKPTSLRNHLRWGYQEMAMDHFGLKQYALAMKDLDTIISLMPNELIPYRIRAKLFRFLHQDARADADERHASQLEMEQKL